MQHVAHSQSHWGLILLAVCMAGPVFRMGRRSKRIV
ncbi:MAG: IPTL-CTERM sorting domain-containing protein [Deltaproteobacteria bacterium]|nr:IPTL-CTERM sorting domain-containing protein [Deltaproteobacteria bacterium]MBW2284037.1 IPTL-CTERM sorting domain-containing protein [Deltaproteobacteria bacterium]